MERRTFLQQAPNLPAKGPRPQAEGPVGPNVKVSGPEGGLPPKGRARP